MTYGTNYLQIYDEDIGVVSGINYDATIKVEQCPQPAGSIKGIVYHDLNINGVRDVGEPGLNGWPVAMDDPMCQCTRLTHTPLSGDLGTYEFANLTAGVPYHVSTPPSTAWTQTQPVNPNDYTIVLQPGTSSLGNNFGEKQISFKRVPAVPGFVGWLIAAALGSIGARRLRLVARRSRGRRGSAERCLPSGSPY